MVTFILAHQSGWDELLLFLGPVVAMIAWVRWAERRARRRRDDAEEPSSNMPSDTDA